MKFSLTRRALLLWAALAATFPLVASAQSVRVTTDMGAFTIQLDAERAPLTVANFLKYVNEGFYNGTLFHRVVGGFVVQGGGYSATDTSRPKTTHDPVVNEAGNGLQNKRATVGMARGNSPHSGNAQFYINVADNPELDPLPTRWGYAVFGRVTDGMDVIDKIAVVATGAVGSFKSEAPLKPIVIQKVELLKGDGSTSSGPAIVNPAVMPSSEGGAAPSAPPPGAPPSGAPPSGTTPPSDTTPPSGTTSPSGATPPPSASSSSAPPPN